MRRKDSDIEFYREAIAILQQEKADYAAERDALRTEVKELKESHRQEMEDLRQTLESMRMTILDQSRNISELSEANKKLMTQLSDALAQGRLSRGKRFAQTTEQSNLLNHRRTDTRAEEKDNFDGDPPSAPSASASDGGAGKANVATRKKKKSEGRKAAKEDYGCDETIRHALGSYFDIPGGAVMKTRGGEVEIHEYESYEYIPGRIIKHVWETATYIAPNRNAFNTLPKEERENPVNGCPFSPD